MKERLGRNSLETVFGVSEIPTDTQIRTILGQTEPEHLSSLFNTTLKIAWESGLLEKYRVLDGGVLTALDGVWYHSSENIRCGRCLHITKDDITTYYHVAPAGAVVKPGDTSVLPVMAEMIANGDGDRYWKRDIILSLPVRTKRTNGLRRRWKTPNRGSGRRGNGTDGIIWCKPAGG